MELTLSRPRIPMMIVWVFLLTGCANYQVVASPSSKGTYVRETGVLNQHLLRCETPEPNKPVCVELSEESGR